MEVLNDFSDYLFVLYMMYLFQKILAKWLEQAARNLELTDKVIPVYLVVNRHFKYSPFCFKNKNIIFNGLYFFLKANWPENGLQLAEVFFTAENELGLASSWSWSSLV